MYNIAILIPCTSNKRNYTSYCKTDLYDKFIKSFLSTYEHKYNYKLFIGIDEDDKFYQDKGVQDNFNRFMSVMKNVDIQFYSFDTSFKGDVGKIWTNLYKYAIDENYDYFLQVGDDVVLLHQLWVTECIEELQKTFNIGVVGLTDYGRKRYNPNDTLITQAFVSRSHYKIFGFLFPPELKSWYIDNYIGDIYEIENLKSIVPQGIENTGGEPRYDIPKDCKEMYDIAMYKYRNKIKDFFKIDVNNNE